MKLRFEKIGPFSYAVYRVLRGGKTCFLGYVWHRKSGWINNQQFGVYPTRRAAMKGLLA